MSRSIEAKKRRNNKERERYKERVGANKLRRTSRTRSKRQIVAEYLLLHPCVDCGEKDPIILTFDHVRGEKILDISKMVNLPSYSVEKLKLEIAKCDIRCCNCHTRKTYRDSHGSNT